MRVNGLFGWVRANDTRSIRLFGGFLLALHLLALPTLFLLLLMFDPAHAPFVAWRGYGVRYVPLITLFALISFAALARANLTAIRRRLPFRPALRAREPRLFRVAEPLAIAAGLPPPRLAVIEDPARNAFAYGLGARSSTLVVTRGLIDALDDDELAAVLAHEFTHIRNGDVRFMVAANAFLASIRFLDRANTAGQINRENVGTRSAAQLYGLWAVIIMPVAVVMLALRREPRTPDAMRGAGLDVRDALGWAVVFTFAPFLAVPLVGMIFARQQALNGGALVRHLVASSREYIADAGAIALTHNPAALVSALRRIEGRSALGDLPMEQGAMMIDGASTGEAATHPTVAQRVAAIVAVTGGMALVAPARRRDTRTAVRGAFGRRGEAAAELPPVLPSLPGSGFAGWRRLAPWNARTLLGLDRRHLVGMALGLVALLALDARLLARPADLAARFDPRAAAPTVAALRMTVLCGSGVAIVMSPETCELERIADGSVKYGEHRDVNGFFRWVARKEAEKVDAERRREADKAAFAARHRCFQGNYVPYQGSPYPVDEVVDDNSIARMIEHLRSSAGDVAASPSDAVRRERLAEYLKWRRHLTEAAYDFWGTPGWQQMAAALDTPTHRAALDALSRELAHPATLSPKDRADARVLLAHPRDFRPCDMVRHNARGQVR